MIKNIHLNLELNINTKQDIDSNTINHIKERIKYLTDTDILPETFEGFTENVKVSTFDNSSDDNEIVDIALNHIHHLARNHQFDSIRDLLTFIPINILQQFSNDEL